MAKKKVARKHSSRPHRSSRNWVPNSLEDPVHNLVGYLVLFALVLVVFWLVWALSGH